MTPKEPKDVGLMIHRWTNYFITAGIGFLGWLGTASYEKLEGVEDDVTEIREEIVSVKGSQLRTESITEAHEKRVDRLESAVFKPNTR